MAWWLRLLAITWYYWHSYLQETAVKIIRPSLLRPGDLDIAVLDGCDTKKFYSPLTRQLSSFHFALALFIAIQAIRVPFENKVWSWYEEWLNGWGGFGLQIPWYCAISWIWGSWSGQYIQICDVGSYLTLITAVQPLSISPPMIGHHTLGSNYRKLDQYSPRCNDTKNSKTTTWHYWSRSPNASSLHRSIRFLHLGSRGLSCSKHLHSSGYLFSISHQTNGFSIQNSLLRPVTGISKLDIRFRYPSNVGIVIGAPLRSRRKENVWDIQIGIVLEPNGKCYVSFLLRIEAKEGRERSRWSSIQKIPRNLTTEST